MGLRLLTEEDKQELQKYVDEKYVNLAKAKYISIPSKVTVKVNSEFKMYYRNVISIKNAQFWVGYNNDLTTRYYDEYMTIVPTKAGSFSLPWKVYDNDGNLLSSGNIVIEATEKGATGNTKALVLGDSTVNAGTMTQKLLSLYKADGGNLTLLGTRGAAPNLHEGRGGWTAQMYCTKASSGGIENPFYNNGFDFLRYMNNENYTDLQCVVIQLGINDIFGFKDYDWAKYDSKPVFGYFDSIINSILQYDSNIKIILNLPITPNSNGTSFTQAYGTTQIYWTYNQNIIRFAEELQKHYANNSSVTISASNCVLDTKTQIRDGIHPTDEGYNILGQRLYEVMINLVDGVATAILDLLRGDAINTSNTVAATDARVLDTTKCYYANMAGQRSSMMGGGDNPYITSFIQVSKSQISIQARSANGTGVEYPVNLEVGKKYRLQYSVNKTSRVYILQYNADTTFSKYTLASSQAGENLYYNITPESGYKYSILFCPFTANEECVFSNVSLEEIS